MKINIQKSDNPIAVGALLCVLTLVVGRTIWLVTHGDNVSASTVVKTADSATVMPASLPREAAVPQPSVSLPRISTPHSTRNPFSSRNHEFAATDKAASPSLAGGGGDVRSAPRLRTTELSLNVRPILPLPAAPPTGKPAAFQGTSAGQNLHAATGKSQATMPGPVMISGPAMPPPNPLQDMKLTAIVGGTQSTAVIQTSQAQPFIVHRGDHLLGMLVVAINDRDVVFASGVDLWTLTLPSSDPTAAAATVTTEDRPAAQENADVRN